jgi:hypothetical protein
MARDHNKMLVQNKLDVSVKKTRRKDSCGKTANFLQTVISKLIHVG